MKKFYIFLFLFFISLKVNANQIINNPFVSRSPDTGKVIRYDSQVSPIFVFAIDENSLEKFIYQGADVNFKSVFGTTPLMWISYFNPDADDIIEELIENGADVNHKNWFGRTALMEALSSFKSEDVVEELIENGADVNLQDNQLNTALIIASSFISPEIINDSNRDDVLNYLKGKKVQSVENHFNMKKDDLDLFLKNSMTYEDRFKNVKKFDDFYEKQDDLEDVIEELLDARADISIKNNKGKTAYDYAKENPYLKDSYILEKLKVKP